LVSVSYCSSTQGCSCVSPGCEPIARAVVADLKERRITMPPPALAERLALAGRALARRQSHRDLIHSLSDAQCAELEGLLTGRAEDGPGATHEKF